MYKYTIILLIGILFPAFVFADMFPAFPMTFYGNARLDGVGLTVGSKIRAISSGEIKGEIVVGKVGVYGLNSAMGPYLSVASFASSSLFFCYVQPGTYSCSEKTSIIKYAGIFNPGSLVPINLDFTSIKPEPLPKQSYGGGSGGPAPKVIQEVASSTNKYSTTTPKVNKPLQDKEKKKLEKEVLGIKIKYSDKDEVIKSEKGLVKRVDKKLAAKLKGKILIQVESCGRAWYISPSDTKKYYLGRPTDAFEIMRKLGLGVKHEILKNTKIYPNYLLGKILIDVGDKGKAYYINPTDKKSYFLGRPSDAFEVMRKFGLGISNDNFRKIEIASN